MKKNILIADPFETGGGEEEVAYYIYKNLDRTKFNVYITGTDQSKYFEKHSPIEQEVIDVFVKGKYDLGRMLSFRKLVRRKKIDIINVHGCSAGFFVRTACAGMKNVKVVWTTHGNIDLIYRKGSFQQWISTKLEDILNKSKLFTDCIVTVCEETGERLRKRGVRKIPITNIYNGIDTLYFSDMQKSYERKDALRLGFFSRLSRQKDIPLLLETMNKFKKNNVNVSLIIAGDGDEKKDVLEYIQQNDLGGNVKYIGFQNDVKKLFREIDVLVLPTHFECLPMILLEAMCTGTPVIASDVGGISEIVHDNFNGIVVEPENLDSFYSAILKFVNNRLLIKEFGLNAQKYVKDNFDVSVMMKKYNKVFME